MFKRIVTDVRVVFNRDPAVRSKLEALTCYPHIKSLWFHRIAHWLWVKERHFTARVVSQFSRFLTGIEIHPGAQIGTGLFIDHGAGVVIGETAEIGDDVTMYQGVVLGGVSLEHKKRHPTIGCEVVIGAGSIILGPINVGDCAKIGANSVVLKDVKPYTTVVGIPAREAGEHVVRDHAVDLDHAKLIDPMMNAIDSLQKQIRSLQKEIEELRRERAGKTR
jgi:serine O-acetyltransferase